MLCISTCEMENANKIIITSWPFPRQCCKVGIFFHRTHDIFIFKCKKLIILSILHISKLLSCKRYKQINIQPNFHLHKVDQFFILLLHFRIKFLFNFNFSFSKNVFSQMIWMTSVYFWKFCWCNNKWNFHVLI